MTMKKLTADDPESRSPDLVAENLERLKALFPELVTEGPNGAAVNVDVLKALVGDATVTDADEKYGLNWHGKRRARLGGLRDERVPVELLADKRHEARSREFIAGVGRERGRIDRRAHDHRAARGDHDRLERRAMHAKHARHS